MSERQVKAWVCDLCGHIWIAGKGSAPEKCAKCRKRAWNKQPSAPKPAAAPRKRPLPPPVTASPSMPALDYKARAAGMTEDDGDPVPAILPKVVEVRVDDVVVPLIPPADEGSEERFSAAIDRLAKPHPKMGEKCPHNWSSWFLCPKCNSKVVPA